MNDNLIIKKSDYILIILHSSCRQLYYVQFILQIKKRLSFKKNNLHLLIVLEYTIYYIY